ncbi:MAG: hypothetical protein AB1444_00530 [Spirochaetota bacterium]
MPHKKYPQKLSDIPKNRQKDLEASILWFLRFSPVDRIKISEQHWDETQDYIQEFSLIKQWKQKKNYHS